jgi:DNA-binding transcriptional LysR family regulator
MPTAFPDWNDLRDILLIAGAGSLSAAARAAGVSQSTMSRRLAAIESGGQPVFLRDETGRLTPNQRGAVLVDAAREMQLVHDRARHALSDAPPPLRVVACDLVARLFLTAAMPDWSGRADIPAEVSIHDSPMAMDARDYDVLVTVMPAVPERSAGAMIGRMDWALHASPAYLRAHPWKGSFDGHHVLCASGGLATVDAFRWLARQGGRIALLTASPVAMLDAAATGMGLALLPRALTQSDSRVVAIDAMTCPPSEVWMIADAEKAVEPRISGFFRWARGYFRPATVKKSA